MLIFQTVVTHASPCTDNDSLIGMSSMAEGVRTSDEIVKCTFDEKMADLSNKYFKGSARCNKIELTKS